MTPEFRRSGSCTREYPEIRQQLIALIRKGGRSRTAVFTHRRPTNIRFGEVDHPESGSALTHVVYVKLQIRGSKVLLRSFHHDEYDRE